VNQSSSRPFSSVTLRPKAFDLLIYLSQRPNQLVTKEELLEACWPGTAVTDASLKVCVREDSRGALRLDNDRLRQCLVNSVVVRGIRRGA
jgi:adenylate cyclase